MLNGLRQGQHHITGQIQPSAGQLRGHLPPPDSQRLQANPRCLFHQLRHQRRQQATLQAIPQAKHKSPLGVGGIEPAFITEATLKPAQRVPDRAHHRPGPGGGHHAAPLAHKQRVSQALAQPSQRVADRRLGQVEHLGRTGQGALGIDGVEYHKQIQIKARNMHRIYQVSF